MTPCKSCATSPHKAWCMRPMPIKPANVHVVRAEFIRACA